MILQTQLQPPVHENRLFPVGRIDRGEDRGDIPAGVFKGNAHMQPGKKSTRQITRTLLPSSN